jgi:hypothetical protein
LKHHRWIRPKVTDDPDADLVEEKMRIVSSLAPMVALTVGVAFAAPVSALAADSAQAFHKHAIQGHRVAGLPSNATALVPVQALVPAAAAKDSDGLSRNSADCNMGCIDH